MKLAFNRQGRYTDFSDGYAQYLKKAIYGHVLDEKTYRKVIREYCKLIAEHLEKSGIVDLPADFGSIAAVMIKRKAQYRGKKFVGYGKMDWKLGHYDGKLKTFGLAYLPRRNNKENLRCFGYVANRRLFKKIKEKAETSEWKLMEFNDEMI